MQEKIKIHSISPGWYLFDDGPSDRKAKLHPVPRGKADDYERLFKEHS